MFDTSYFPMGISPQKDRGQGEDRGPKPFVG